MAGTLASLEIVRRIGDAVLTAIAFVEGKAFCGVFPEVGGFASVAPFENLSEIESRLLRDASFSSLATLGGCFPGFVPSFASRSFFRSSLVRKSAFSLSACSSLNLPSRSLFFASNSLFLSRCREREKETFRCKETTWKKRKYRTSSFRLTRSFMSVWSLLMH